MEGPAIEVKIPLIAGVTLPSGPKSGQKGETTMRRLQNFSEADNPSNGWIAPEHDATCFCDICIAAAEEEDGLIPDAEYDIGKEK